MTGSAGQISGGALNHPAHYISLNNLGSFVIDVNGTRLDATFVKSDGSTPDTFTIIKQGAADSDSDGIPDDYETANGLDRKSAADALLDTDYDGLKNLDEYTFGLNLHVSDSYDVAVIHNVQTSVTSVTFPTSAARNYTVWYSDDLNAWNPASSAFVGNGSTQTWVDDGSQIPLTTNNRRFYKVVVITLP